MKFHNVLGQPILMCGHCDTVFPSGSYPDNPFYIDAAYFGSLGIPTVCSMGGQGAGAHTKEEYASVDSFFTRWFIAMSCILEIQDYVNDYRK